MGYPYTVDDASNFEHRIPHCDSEIGALHLSPVVVYQVNEDFVLGRSSSTSRITPNSRQNHHRLYDQREIDPAYDASNSERYIQEVDPLS